MLTCPNCNREINTLYEFEVDEKKYRKLCKLCIENNLKQVKELIRDDCWVPQGNDLKKYLSYKGPSTYKEAKEKQMSGIFKDLDELIGLENIKQEVKEWILQLEGRKKAKKDKRLKLEPHMMHMFLTGSPGTGKTVLGKIIAEILFKCEMLQENKIIEVTQGDLVGEHVGQTVPKTEKMIEKAKGGMLFIDEAYQLVGEGLKGSKSDFGQEALDTIMKAMEKDKDGLVVVFAGYEDKMEVLFESNEGLKSRIAHKFFLKDYTPKELNQIAIKMLTKKGYNIEQIKDKIENVVEDLTENGIINGNARTIRTLIEKISTKHLVRIAKEDVDDITVLLPLDVERAILKNPTENERNGLKEVLEKAEYELNNLEGLKTVKKEVEKIKNFQIVQQKRREKGLKVQKVSNHMFFFGSPGTGKTTVAKIIGQVLRGTNSLSNGHIVEVSREDLISSGGMTPKKVKQIVKKAMGGVLFIDEAYSLASNDGLGNEVIDVLVKLMEENRNDLVVIFAGYEKEMQKLLTMNKGLKSRIPHHFYFPNYKTSEIINITKKFIIKNDYELDIDAEFTLVENLERIVKNEGMIPGNARWVRNLFEKILVAQSQRIVENFDEELKIIKEMDVLDALFEMELELEKEKIEIGQDIKDKDINFKIEKMLDSLLENEVKLKRA